MCNGHKPNGDRCGISWGLNDLGYCRHHIWQGRPRCQGFEIGTKQRCTNAAKPDYGYCCATHDPTIPYTSPNVLNPSDADFRETVQSDVVTRCHGIDIYNREDLDLATPYALDLDHILEKQCFTYVLYKMELHPGDETWHLATEVLQDSVVNVVDNLTLTRPSTNRIKGAAVWKYLDDQRTGHLDNTFTGYLLAAERDHDRLDRDVTRRITRNMGRSIKKSRRQLSKEGETPVLKQLSKQLQQLYVEMELKTP
ncbi:hypothetical protein PRNP1_006322 [Phytophthora ramorum]